MLYVWSFTSFFITLEEGMECGNKDTKHLRSHNTYKGDYETVMEQLTLRMVDRSDPLILEQRLEDRLKMRKHEELPPVVEAMVDKDSPYYNITRAEIPLL